METAIPGLGLGVRAPKSKGCLPRGDGFIYATLRNVDDVDSLVAKGLRRIMKFYPTLR